MIRSQAAYHTTPPVLILVDNYPILFISITPNVMYLCILIDVKRRRGGIIIGQDLMTATVIVSPAASVARALVVANTESIAGHGILQRGQKLFGTSGGKCTKKDVTGDINPRDCTIWELI